LKFAKLFYDKKQNDKVIYLYGLSGLGRSALVKAILRQAFNSKVA
jgi:chromosomal replication initiation ATPase DnaA